MVEGKGLVQRERGDQRREILETMCHHHALVFEYADATHPEKYYCQNKDQDERKSSGEVRSLLKKNSTTLRNTLGYLKDG